MGLQSDSGVPMCSWHFLATSRTNLLAILWFVVRCPAETYPTPAMAWDSSSSSDEPLQQRASRRILSGRTPRQIPLLADSSDEEIASVSPKIVKPREGEKAEQDAKSETGDSRDSSPAKELSLAKFAPEKPENVESNVADVAPADTSLVDSNSERSESKSVVRTQRDLKTFQAHLKTFNIF